MFLLEGHITTVSVAPEQVAAPWVEDSVKAELKKLLTEASAVKNDQAAAVRPKPTVSWSLFDDDHGRR